LAHGRKKFLTFGPKPAQKGSLELPKKFQKHLITIADIISILQKIFMLFETFFQKNIFGSILDFFWIVDLLTLKFLPRSIRLS
jgi:hypothetical protein